MTCNNSIFAFDDEGNLLRNHGDGKTEKVQFLSQAESRDSTREDGTKFLFIKLLYLDKTSKYKDRYTTQFKCEINLKTLNNKHEVRDEVVDYITWSNAKRLHVTLGYTTPFEHEALFYRKVA